VVLSDGRSRDGSEAPRTVVELQERKERRERALAKQEKQAAEAFKAKQATAEPVTLEALDRHAPPTLRAAVEDVEQAGDGSTFAAAASSCPSLPAKWTRANTGKRRARGRRESAIWPRPTSSRAARGRPGRGRQGSRPASPPVRSTAGPVKFAPRFEPPTRDRELEARLFRLGYRQRFQHFAGCEVGHRPRVPLRL
jgi:hypothetical protein